MIKGFQTDIHRNELLDAPGKYDETASKNLDEERRDRDGTYSCCNNSEMYCGFLLVLVLDQTGFLRVIRFFALLKDRSFQNSNSVQNSRRPRIY